MVKQRIEMFPTMEEHYCREETQKHYFHTKMLTIIQKSSGYTGRIIEFHYHKLVHLI